MPRRLPPPSVVVSRPAVPVDMALCLAAGGGACGESPGAIVGVRPHRPGRYWVAVLVLRAAVVRTASGPLPARRVAAFVRRWGVDPHRLDWWPRTHPATPTNPYEDSR